MLHVHANRLGEKIRWCNPAYSGHCMSSWACECHSEFQAAVPARTNHLPMELPHWRNSVRYSSRPSFLWTWNHSQRRRSRSKPYVHLRRHCLHNLLHWRNPLREETRVRERQVATKIRGSSATEGLVFVRILESYQQTRHNSVQNTERFWQSSTLWYIQPHGRKKGVPRWTA